MSWRVETLNNVVDRELEALPADMLAYLQRIVGLIETFGLELARFRARELQSWLH